MNHLYLVSTLVSTSMIIGFACRWARMSPSRTITHILVAPIALPALGAALFIGISMPLALLSPHVLTLGFTVSDQALQLVAAVATTALLILFAVAYFRSERPVQRSDESLGPNPATSLVPKTSTTSRPSKKIKSIAEEYKEIRANWFTTGTVYVLPKRLTYPTSNDTSSRNSKDIRSSQNGSIHAFVRKNPNPINHQTNRFT